VALLNVNSKPFFSEHPVINLDTDKRAQDFLARYPVVYAVVNKAMRRYLEQLPAAAYQPELIAQFGDKFLMKVVRRS